MMRTQFSKKAFQPAKMQLNPIYACHIQTNSQHVYHNISSLPKKIQTNNFFSQNKGNIESSQQIVDLQDLWDQVQGDKSKGKIQIRHLTAEEPIFQAQQTVELSQQEYDQIFGKENQQPQKNNQNTQIKHKLETKIQANQIKVSNPHQQCDLQDLWNQVENTQDPVLMDSKPQKTEIKQSKKQEAKNKMLQNRLNIVSVHSQGHLQLGKDFLIYDYKSFVLNCFEGKIHTYFIFNESNSKKGHFRLADSQDNSIVQCITRIVPRENLSYQDQVPHLYFHLSTGDHLATALPQKSQNGVVYILRAFDQYQHIHDQPMAWIQTSDAFMGKNCYCSSSAVLVEGNQKLKMTVGVKKGCLIANMGVQGVKSAPYNCRLENNQKNFVYLLGMMQNGHFVVRVGQGISPLIALAISVARKLYIDSFQE